MPAACAAIGTSDVSVMPGRDVHLEDPGVAVGVDDDVHAGQVAEAERCRCADAAARERRRRPPRTRARARSGPSRPPCTARHSRRRRTSARSRRGATARAASPTSPAATSVPVTFRLDDRRAAERQRRHHRTGHVGFALDEADAERRAAPGRFHDAREPHALDRRVRARRPRRGRGARTLRSRPTAASAPTRAQARPSRAPCRTRTRSRTPPSRVGEARADRAALDRAILTFLAVQGKPDEVGTPLLQRFDERDLARIDEPRVVAELRERGGMRWAPRSDTSRSGVRPPPRTAIFIADSGSGTAAPRLRSSAPSRWIPSRIRSSVG